MTSALIALALLVGGWEAYTRLSGIDPLLLPPPTDVAAALWTERSALGSDLLVTATEIVLGLVVAVVGGLLAALALHSWPRLRSGSYPLLVASQAIPIVVVAPLLVAWLGFGLLPKIVIIALICFFPVTVTTLDALGRVDPQQRTMLRSLGARRMQTIRWLELPSALPAALSGAKVAVAVGSIAAVFAEYAGSDSGLGHLLLTSIPQLRADLAWATVVVLAALAVSCVAVISAAERRLIPWTDTRKDR